MKRLILILIAISSIVFIASIEPLQMDETDLHESESISGSLSVKEKNKTVQVALLLDTSGSMNGLLEQAKSQLWSILNELSRLEKLGESANLQIALYEYGNPTKTENSDQISLITDFTTDMDMISEKLFALSTNGGDEYCGTIIKNSVEDLSWYDKENLKLIYIAGNESFRQGPVDIELASSVAKYHEVIVNTIFCGDLETGISEHWLQGAQLANGAYVNIDQNKKTIYVSSPFDDEINRLNKDLNDTYIPYGDSGIANKRNQKTQDDNAGSYTKENSANRTVFKSSKNYKAEKWDLIDAYKKDQSVIERIDIKDNSLANLTIEELEQRVREISNDRSEIQAQIMALNKKRIDYINSQQKEDGVTSLHESILSTIKKQAEAKGYQLNDL